MIGNILRVDDSASWYALIDKTSGAVEKFASGKLPDQIIKLFGEIVDMRNRIIHGFRITNSEGEQVIATKEKSGNQFEITEDYLVTFIKKNETLPDVLHAHRGH